MNIFGKKILFIFLNILKLPLSLSLSFSPYLLPLSLCRFLSLILSRIHRQKQRRVSESNFSTYFPVPVWNSIESKGEERNDVKVCQCGVKLRYGLLPSFPPSLYLPIFTFLYNNKAKSFQSGWGTGNSNWYLKRWIIRLFLSAAIGRSILAITWVVHHLHTSLIYFWVTLLGCTSGLNLVSDLGPVLAWFAIIISQSSYAQFLIHLKNGHRAHAVCCGPRMHK